MKRLVWPALALAALACGKSGTTTSPYFVSTSVPDPFDPFVISVVWEPSAGHVDSYTIEVKPPGGSFTDLHFLSAFAAGLPQGNYVDLAQVVPNGGPVTLRVRADPGGFESNELTYNPGPALSTVSVSPVPDPTAQAFLVHYGNRSAPQVFLERRIIDTTGHASDYVIIASGTGADIAFSDTDLAEWTDGTQFEYQAISSAPGAIASRSATTNRSAAIAPSILSYLPDQAGAVVVVRNNSHFPAFLDVRTFFTSDTFPRNDIGFGNAGPGGTISVRYTNPSPLAHFSVSAQTGFASGVDDEWRALQPAGAPLQPTLRTLQFGSSAVRNAAGDFCIVEGFRSSFTNQNLGSAVFAPGAPADPLVLQIPAGVRCRIDSSGRSHVIWFQPPATQGGLGQVMHSWHDGTAWNTEAIASHPSVSAFGQSLQDGSVAFDIGVDGTIFGAWYVSAGSIELATLTSGQPWSLQAIPASPEAGFVLVSGDESGVPHLITLAFFGNYHLFQGASGWTAQAINPQFQIGEGSGDMSVAGGIVRFVSFQKDNNFRFNYVSGNSAGWGIEELSLSSFFFANDVQHSADGKNFVVVGNTVDIIRDGAISSSTVPGSGNAGGFSANGKAWVLEWTPGQPTPTIAAPALQVPAFVFDEQ
jgi:hypothetical protein